MEGGLLVGAAF